MCVCAGGLQPPAGGIGGHRRGAEELSQSFLGETRTAIRQKLRTGRVGVELRTVRVGGYGHRAEESPQSFLGETGTAVWQSCGGLKSCSSEEFALGG